MGFVVLSIIFIDSLEISGTTRHVKPEKNEEPYEGKRGVLHGCCAAALRRFRGSSEVMKFLKESFFEKNLKNNFFEKNF